MHARSPVSSSHSHPSVFDALLFCCLSLLSLSRFLIAFTQFQWAMGKHITERKLIEMGCKFADHLFTHLIYESMACRILLDGDRFYFTSLFWCEMSK